MTRMATGGAVDVRVMGAGIFGLACAWEMARRGARVQVVDPHGPGAGASGGPVGALAPHAPGDGWTALKAFQLDSLLAAPAFWAGVEAAGGGDPGYARSGRVQPLDTDAAVARARARVAEAARLWRGAATWTVIGADAVPGWPAGALRAATGLAVHDTLSARLHPARACAALAAAIVARGGSVATAPDGPAGATLWATGHAGLAELSRAFGRPVGAGVKGQALRLRLPAPRAAAGWPQIFADGLYIVPHADGTLAVGSTSERDFTDSAGTDAQADALRARAEQVLPMLRDAAETGRWAGVRPRARSREPMLGPWPGRPGHFIANGGFRIGFGVAPGVARVMADLILTGRADIPNGFRPEASL